jgi:hypothetical protein
LAAGKSSGTEAKEKNQNYECQYCGKRFGRKYTFKQHLGIHDQTLHMYRCELCNKSFAYKTTLKKHNIAVHNNRDLSSSSVAANHSHDDSTAGGTEEEEHSRSWEPHGGQLADNAPVHAVQSPVGVPDAAHGVQQNGTTFPEASVVVDSGSWSGHPVEVKQEKVEDAGVVTSSALGGESPSSAGPVVTKVRIEVCRFFLYIWL